MIFLLGIRRDFVLSIKSQGQELFIGQEKITLISFWGNKYIMNNDDVLNVEYKFATFLQEGYIKFYSGSAPVSFYFTNKKNASIQKGIDYLTEKEIVCEESNPLQRVPFYQSIWFTVLMMFCCCFPVGLFLMWRYRKFTLVVRGIVTILFGALFCKYLIDYISVMNAIDSLTDSIKNLGISY